MYFSSAMVINKSIKNWVEDERPREKMMQKGAAALTDAELLAILISSGTRERTALDLARDVLALAGNNLHGLGRLNIMELKKIKGIGEARAITVCAAMELGRRRQAGQGVDKITIRSSRDAAAILMPMLQDHHHEVFCILYMNHVSKYLKHEVLSSGGMSATVVDIRMILKNCLLHNAAQFIMAHNHPSGSKDPSQADRKLTADIKEAAKLMQITLADHLIIAGNEYLSMADEGLM